jgi:hypothetical protein
MIKRFIIFGLFVNILGIVLVTKVSAISSSIVISQIQTASSFSATQEFIELNNNSDSKIDLSGWQVQYKSASGSEWSKLSDLSGIVTARDFVLLSSQTTTETYIPAANFFFSAGLAAPGGHIRITDNNGFMIDQIGWGSANNPEGTAVPAPVAGQSLIRNIDANGSFIDSDNNSSDFAITDSPSPHIGALEEPVEPTGCSAGQTSGENGECQTSEITTVVPCDNQVVLSEFLTDPVGLEENGGEFIELYNPGDSDAVLTGCHLKSSKSSTDLVAFSDDDIVPAHGYYVVNLVNKLTNSSGSINFTTANNNQSINYNSLQEGQSNALINDQWQVTSKSTPGRDNELVTFVDEPVTVTLSPCPSGKYRNPATNRCKNIEDESSSLKPCAADQYRSSETNRCRNISSASTSLAACKEGYERNPDTNRCRKITNSNSTLVPCAVGYERNAETNRCRKVSSGSSALSSFSQPATTNPANFNPKIVVLVSVLTLGYGAWEYRTEIMNGGRKIVQLFSKLKLG